MLNFEITAKWAADDYLWKITLFTLLLVLI